MLKPAVEICKKTRQACLVLDTLDVRNFAANLKAQASSPLFPTPAPVCCRQGLPILTANLLPSALRLDGALAQHSYMAYLSDLAKSVYQNQAGKK